MTKGGENEDSMVPISAFEFWLFSNFLQLIADVLFARLP